MAITAIAFSACFSPWKGGGETGTLTVSLGGSGGDGRVMGAGTAPDNPGILAQLTHVITLKGPEEIRREVKGATSIIMRVPSGIYEVTVESYCGDMLYGKGTSVADIQRGQPNRANVTIDTSVTDTIFHVVSKDDDWYDTIDLIRGGAGTNHCIVLAANTKSNTVYSLTTQTVLVIGNGHSITNTIGGGSLLQISGADVTLQDVNLVGKDNAGNVPIMINGGSVTMKGSSSVSGNTATSGNGGGVCVQNNGIFTMQDNARVYNNKNNSGTGGGGGVVVISGEFIMEDNAKVYNNGAVTGQAGGVSVGSSGQFTMKDNASVYGNTAATNGGGVVVAGGTFTMSGGTITGNTTPGSGGGVYMSNGTFYMNPPALAGPSGSIRGNTSANPPTANVWNNSMGTVNVNGDTDTYKDGW